MWPGPVRESRLRASSRMLSASIWPAMVARKSSPNQAIVRRSRLRRLRRDTSAVSTSTTSARKMKSGVARGPDNPFPEPPADHMSRASQGRNSSGRRAGNNPGSRHGRPSGFRCRAGFTTTRAWAQQVNLSDPAAFQAGSQFVGNALAQRGRLHDRAVGAVLHDVHDQLSNEESAKI